MHTETLTAESVEHDLAELLEVERFDPPEEFAANANIRDGSVYDEAEADFQGFWLRLA
jgi:acetyl-CoA synthetase